MKHPLIGLVMCLACGAAVGVHEQPPRQPGVYRLEELTWPQIDALDRDRTSA
ncbi:MAG TPA: hypothetical protein VFM39_03835 [bacterium]|nr:hypothetical protein [bacterium]